MTTNQHVSEKILRMLIEKTVSEKLGGLTREFADFTKGMDDAEKKETALMILEMLGTATNEFLAKMKIRIESSKKV